MNTDERATRLAGLKKPCLRCQGKGYEPTAADNINFGSCLDCGGSGDVYLLAGVQDDCAHKEALKRGWLVPRDCFECKARGWLATKDLERWMVSIAMPILVYPPEEEELVPGEEWKVRLRRSEGLAPLPGNGSTLLEALLLALEKATE